MSTIAEKLATVAENQQKVYDAGYAAGMESGGGSGGDNHYDAFWDAYQQNGERTDYKYAFNGSGWTDETFDPKYDIKPKLADQMIAFCEITNLKQLLIDKGITIDTSGSTDVSYMCRTSSFTHLPFLDLSGAEYYGATFAYCPDLIELSIKVQERGTYPNCFDQCPMLTDVTISGTIGTSIRFIHSPLLSTESVQSIIDALKDLTGATAQKVYFHSTVLAKITDEQFATITAKNWTM